MAPGNRAPGGEVFLARMPPLYGMGYTLKFASKAAGCDCTVGRLEGIWWAEVRELPVVADIDPADRRFGGRHHEIYLSDPIRTAPERLRNTVGDEHLHWQIFS